MSTKTPREDIIDKLEEIFVAEYRKTYGPDLACTVAHAWIGLLLPVIETLLEECRQEMKNKILVKIQERYDEGNNEIDADFEKFILSL